MKVPAQHHIEYLQSRYLHLQCLFATLLQHCAIRTCAWILELDLFSTASKLPHLSIRSLFWALHFSYPVSSILYNLLLPLHLQRFHCTAVHLHSRSEIHFTTLILPYVHPEYRYLWFPTARYVLILPRYFPVPRYRFAILQSCTCFYRLLHISQFSWIVCGSAALFCIFLIKHFCILLFANFCSIYY